jgi:hypothetical protein
MFTKPKSLKQQLLAMEIGEQVEVKTRTYKVTSIRVAVTRLRKDGFDFIVTEQGCIDCCKVTRVK